MTVRKKRWQCATCKHGWFRRYRDSDVMGIYGCLLPKPGQFTGYAKNTRLPCRDFESVNSFLYESGRRLGIQRAGTSVRDVAHWQDDGTPCAMPQRKDGEE